MSFFGRSRLVWRLYRPRPWVVPDVGPARRLVERAGEARGLHEGLDEHGRGDLLPG